MWLDEDQQCLVVGTLEVAGQDGKVRSGNLSCIPLFSAAQASWSAALLVYWRPTDCSGLLEGNHQYSCNWALKHLHVVPKLGILAEVYRLNQEAAKDGRMGRSERRPETPSWFSPMGQRPGRVSSWTSSFPNTPIVGVNIMQKFRH